jgi:periplasmic protein TonB
MPWPRWIEWRRPAGALNLLDLPRPARRRQGIYWTSVIASIVVHGGFLAYVVGSRPRFPAMNAELIATALPPALQRGDREDPPELLAGDDPQDARLDGEDASPGMAEAGTAAIAAQLEDPLPEDHASAGKLLPPAEWLPDRRLATNSAGGTPAAAMPRVRRTHRMSLPARRMSLIPATAGQSEWGRDAVADGALAIPAAIPLPPAPLPAAPENVAAPAGSEERRASVLDMGAQGSPVVAVLPKEAGVAMFAMRMAEDGPLPEDRSLAPRDALPEQSQQTHAVPLPARRVAAIAAQAEPKLAEGKRESGAAAGDSKRLRAYQAKVRAHLSANKPAGGYGAGRAVVAFNLSPAGGLVSARIVRSSGRPSLDKSVLASVFRSEPFPKPPAGLDPEQLRFRIPFEFR